MNTTDSKTLRLNATRKVKALEKALAAQDAAAGTGLSFLAEIMSGGDIYGDLEAARAELAEVNDIIRARGAASRPNYVRANASVYVGAV